MRLVHLSDTHLGRSEYSAYDPDLQINQREADIYRAFGEVVDYILDTSPDLVIHAGDLFDSIRPSNRAMSEAFRQLSRISEARIPTVVVAGNHSTPRDRSTGTVFDLLGYIKHVHPVYGGMYEKIPLPDVAVHAIPHTYSDIDLIDSMRQLSPDDSFKYNVMVTHAAIKGAEKASWGEFKEQVIPLDFLDPKFDYIALGHYHKHIKIQNNAYYSGSPERINMREINDVKGFLDVELGSLPPRHVPTNVREMIDLGPIDCEGASAGNILKKFEAVLPAEMSGKILRVTFDNIEGHMHAALNRKRMRDLVSACTHCETRYNWKAGEASGMSTTTSIGSLKEEFEAFMKGNDGDSDYAQAMTKKGAEYLAMALEKEVP